MILISVAVMAGGLDGWLAWRQVGRLAVQPVGGGSGTTFLLVGSDNRGTLGPAGERADAIVVVRTDADGGPTAVTIPRDLLVTFPDGRRDRLTVAWDASPQLLVDLVCTQLGVGADHIVEVDVAGLGSLVDAVEGVDIVVPARLVDGWVGLDLAAGPATLDGVTAVAYVRSRRGLVHTGGAWVVEPEPEAARRRRAAEVLGEVADGLAPRWADPVGLHRAAWAAGGAVRVDASLGPADALSLGRALAVVAGDADERLIHLPATVAPGAVPAATLAPGAGEGLATVGGGRAACSLPADRPPSGALR